MKRLAILCWCIFFATDSTSSADLSLKAVDENGRAISTFEIYAIGIGASIVWTRSREGIVQLEQIPDGSMEIIARSDGFATTVKNVPFVGSPKPDSILTIVMERGRQLELQLRPPQDMQLPKGFVPEVFFDGYQPIASRSWQGLGEFRDFNMLNAKPIGRNRYSVRFPSTPRKLVVGVHLPGILRGFTSESLDQSDFENGVCLVDLPRPAAISVIFSLGVTPPHEKPFTRVHAEIECTQRESYFKDSVELSPGETIRKDDLAPGDYSVSVQTVPRSRDETVGKTEINPGRFWDRRELALSAGKSAVADFVFQPFDALAYQGKRLVNIRVLNREEKPASGHKVQVLYFDGHYGYLEVFSGAVPDDGEIKIAGITDKISAGASDQYVISIDGKRQDSFRVRSLDEVQTFEFQIVPVPGDPSPDIPLIALDTQRKTSLSKFQGQIVIIEFWSTNCAPCQPAMDKLNALARENIKAWKDDVIVVGLSIDDDAATARKHIERRGWTDIKHYWAGAIPEGAFLTGAQKAFGISGIPTTLIIDVEGTIRWRNNLDNPQVDLKRVVQSLLFDK